MARAVAELLDGALARQPLALGRLLTLVESDRDDAALREVAARLTPLVGRARVLGLTGPPGAGKSTSTSALVTQFRRADRRVAVLAVDPSSPFSGGALLGDRVRMGEHAGDAEVFIRSMASRGRLGGLAAAVPQAVRVLDAAGFDVVLVETVGVGQAEVEIASLADTTVVVLAPGLGDGVQAAKAGILEIADVFVVNKADRDGADQLARDLRHLQTLATGAGGAAGAAERGWRPPIVRTVATEARGVEDVVAALEAHERWLESSGGLARRREARAAVEVEAMVQDAVRVRLDGAGGSGQLADWARRVAAGEASPYEAADALWTALERGAKKR